MSFSGETFFVGLVALALLPILGWRILRGVREGRLPIYRSYLARKGNAAKFNALLALHVLVFLLLALVAADLLLGLGLRERL